MTVTDSKADRPIRPAGTRAVLVVVLGAHFCMIAAIGTVTIAVPAIESDLRASDAHVQWLLLAFQFGFAILLITGGRLGDIFGNRRLLLTGFGGFIAGTALGAAAPSPELLIVSRLCQGLSAGLAAPQVLAVIQSLFPGPERIKAVSAFAAISGSGFMFGQLITAGMLRANPLSLDWRAAFLIYVPVGVCAWLGAYVVLPRLKRSEGEKLDFGGIVLGSVFLFLLIFPLIQGPDSGWRVVHLVALALVPVFGVIFIRHQLYLTGIDPHKPLIRADLFRVRSFVLGMGVSAILSAVAVGQSFYITIGLQTAFDLSPLETAIATAPMPLMFMLGSAAASRLVAYMGRRIVGLSAVMLAISTGAMLMLITFREGDPSLVETSPIIGGMGMSYGLSMSPTINFSLSDISLLHAGVSSGILQTVRQLANVLGVVLFGAVFFGAGGSQSGASLQDSLGDTMRLALLFCFILFVSQFVFSRRLNGR